MQLQLAHPVRPPLLQQASHHFRDTVQARDVCRAAGEVGTDFFDRLRRTPCAARND
jgi:hypothetical protein